MITQENCSFAHILALQELVLANGIPHAYYADQHKIFRYVKDRDKNNSWNEYAKFTDDVDPQWRQVVKMLGIEPIYALSAQAKGKIERPYGWMQDHLVRTFVRENITNVEKARKILKSEVSNYNNRRVHSTTGEIPNIRFGRAIREGKSVFREFKLELPYQSVKDIFCLRATRVVDSYQRVSFQNNTFQLSDVMPRQDVELKLYPDPKTGLTEVRFWHNDSFIGSEMVKNERLPIVHF